MQELEGRGFTFHKSTMNGGLASGSWEWCKGGGSLTPQAHIGNGDDDDDNDDAGGSGGGGDDHDHDDAVDVDNWTLVAHAYCWTNELSAWHRARVTALMGFDSKVLPPMTERRIDPEDGAACLGTSCRSPGQKPVEDNPVGRSSWTIQLDNQFVKSYGPGMVQLWSCWLICWRSFDGASCASCGRCTDQGGSGSSEVHLGGILGILYWQVTLAAASCLSCAHRYSAGSCPVGSMAWSDESDMPMNRRWMVLF